MTKGAVNEPEEVSYLGEQESKESVGTGAKKALCQERGVAHCAFERSVRGGERRHPGIQLWADLW